MLFTLPGFQSSLSFAGGDASLDPGDSESRLSAAAESPAPGLTRSLSSDTASSERLLIAHQLLSNARGEWSLVSSLQCALLLGREQETSGEFQEQENRKIAKEVHGLQFTLLRTVQNQNSAWKLWFPRGPAVTIAEVAAAAVLKTRVNL